ncbi:MAG TPA: hypothetical protein VFE47_23805 [Tepidisphaeraceae bacterium]|nr:hypothetical protein [Tepidisphaeraceae bacterium]
MTIPLFAIIALHSGARAADNVVPANSAYPRAIFFVCDVSAGMKPNMPVLRRELGRAILSLRANQEFNIVLMREGEPMVFDTEPRVATSRNKKAAIAFVARMNAAGGAGSLDAMALAIRHQPRLVYMLVGREFPAEKALGKIRDLRPKYQFRMNFVLFADSSQADIGWQNRMKQISEETAGHCRTILTNDPYIGSYYRPAAARLQAGPVSQNDGCIPDGGDNVIFVQSRHPRRIVFVVDVQPVLLDCMPIVLREMGHAIDGLSPDQSFDIIFSRQHSPRLISDDLVPATRENKWRFGHITATATADRRNDPLAAIAAAFELHPEVIYFIAGQAFRDAPAVENQFARLNPDKDVEVNTIAMADYHALPVELIDSLRIIAQEDRGVFRRVNVDEMSGDRAGR